MSQKFHNNKLRKGVKTNKLLKNSFYQFIYQKHIDWAIILGCFFVLLPYVASTTWYFLISKIIVLAVVLYLMGRYLLTWNELRQYYETQETWEEAKKKLVNSEKIEDATTMLQELTTEIEKIPQKAKTKQEMYKDFNEYLKYDKIDFIPIEEIINKDKETTKTTLGLVLSVLISLMVLREIPVAEYKNYKRIWTILILTIIFFIIYTIEFWINK